MKIFELLHKHFIIIIFWDFILSFSQLSAQEISSPHNFKINAVYQNGTSILTLKWQLTDYENLPTGYLLYYANGETRELADFSILDTIFTATDSLYYGQEDTVRWVRCIMSINNQQLTPEVYSFYLKSYNDSATSEHSNIVIIRIIDHNAKTIKFTSTPVKSGKINHEYRYDANAEANVDGTILFEAVQMPDGMVLGEESGVVEWTPTVAGRYQVILKAYLQNDTNVSVTQSWEIWVKSCDTASIIFVKVTDQNDQPVNFGMVKVYSYENDSLIFLYAGLIKNGWFAHDGLDQGTYYLYFYCGEDYLLRFENEWYQDTQYFEEATPIILSCNQRDTIEAEVETIPTYSYYRISGMVRRENNDEGIHGAVVEFWGRVEATGCMKKFATTTNSSGEYVIELSEQYQYIALAHTHKEQGNIDTTLLWQYYNQVDNPTEATVLTLTENRDDINFYLPQRPFYSNTFDGTVIDENSNTLANIFIIAFLVETGPWDTDFLYKSRATTSNESGYFQFNNMIPGEYILLAVERDSSIYIPGYYKNNQVAVRSWNDATHIIVDSTGDAGEYTFKLGLREAIGYGGGGLQGNVYGNGGVIKTNDLPQSGTAIAGAFVYLIHNNNVFYYTYTDTEGYYKIDNLALGEYQIFIDKVGYGSYSGEIGIIKENEMTSANPVVLEKKETSSTFDVIDNNYKEVLAYPNPTSDELTLLFSGTPGDARISMINTSGLVVSKTSIPTESGLNSYTYNTDKIPSGIYLIKIETGTKIAIIPVTVLK